MLRPHPAVREHLHSLAALADATLPRATAIRPALPHGARRRLLAAAQAVHDALADAMAITARHPVDPQVRLRLAMEVASAALALAARELAHMPGAAAALHAAVRVLLWWADPLVAFADTPALRQCGAPSSEFVAQLAGTAPSLPPPSGAAHAGQQCPVPGRVKAVADRLGRELGRPLPAPVPAPPARGASPPTTRTTRPSPRPANATPRRALPSPVVHACAALNDALCAAERGELSSETVARTLASATLAFQGMARAADSLQAGTWAWLAHCWAAVLADMRATAVDACASAAYREAAGSPSLAKLQVRAGVVAEEALAHWRGAAGCAQAIARASHLPSGTLLVPTCPVPMPSTPPAAPTPTHEAAPECRAAGSGAGRVARPASSAAAVVAVAVAAAALPSTMLHDEGAGAGTGATGEAAAGERASQDAAAAGAGVRVAGLGLLESALGPAWPAHSPGEFPPLHLLPRAARATAECLACTPESMPLWVVHTWLLRSWAQCPTTAAAAQRAAAADAQHAWLPRWLLEGAGHVRATATAEQRRRIGAAALRCAEAQASQGLGGCDAFQLVGAPARRRAPSRCSPPTTAAPAADTRRSQMWRWARRRRWRARWSGGTCARGRSPGAGRCGCVLALAVRARAGLTLPRAAQFYVALVQGAAQHAAACALCRAFCELARLELEGDGPTPSARS